MYEDEFQTLCIALFATCLLLQGIRGLKGNVYNIKDQPINRNASFVVGIFFSLSGGLMLINLCLILIGAVSAFYFFVYLILMSLAFIILNRSYNMSKNTKLNSKNDD